MRRRKGSVRLVCGRTSSKSTIESFNLVLSSLLVRSKRKPDVSGRDRGLRSARSRDSLNWDDASCKDLGRYSGTGSRATVSSVLWSFSRSRKSTMARGFWDPGYRWASSSLRSTRQFKTSLMVGYAIMLSCLFHFSYRRTAFVCVSFPLSARMWFCYYAIFMTCCNQAPPVQL